ncbi:unnamed protein product, partial [Allacma fusca]
KRSSATNCSVRYPAELEK